MLIESWRPNEFTGIWNQDGANRQVGNVRLFKHDRRDPHPVASTKTEFLDRQYEFLPHV